MSVWRAACRQVPYAEEQAIRTFRPRTQHVRLPRPSSLRVTQRCRRSGGVVVAAQLGSSAQDPRAESINAATETIYAAQEARAASNFGWDIPPEEVQAVDSSGGSAQYGELSHTDRLLWLLALTRDHVFCDLGSGRGKLVLHAALKTAVGYSLGVEMSRHRHDLALDAMYALQKDHAGLEERVELVWANFMRGPFIEESTHIYMCNTVFGDSISNQVAERCFHSDKFKVLLTTKRLHGAPWLKQIGEFKQQYTWDDDGLGYVYAKRRDDVPARLLDALL